MALTPTASHEIYANARNLYENCFISYCTHTPTHSYTHTHTHTTTHTLLMHARVIVLCLRKNYSYHVLAGAAFSAAARSDVARFVLYANSLLCATMLLKNDNKPVLPRTTTTRSKNTSQDNDNCQLDGCGCPHVKFLVRCSHCGCSPTMKLCTEICCYRAQQQQKGK